jgi:hypothetical protein
VDNSDDKNPADKNETSPGGSTVYRYEEQAQTGWRLPAGQGVFAEAVCKHFEALFPGRETVVFHEILSDLVHIDVNIMKPTEKDNFHVIYTTGMSDLPMTLPDSIENKDDLKYAELFMFLPGDWNSGGAGTISNDMPYEDYWPINLIKFLARFPHEYKTWLAGGHTIPNGADYEPILDGSEMSGTVLLELDDNFSPLVTESGNKVRLYMAMPITRAEMEYKLEHGMSALDEKFSEHDLQLVVDMYRKSFV